MPRRACPRCESRLPYAGRRCRRCGWNALLPEEGEAPGRARVARRVGIAALVALVLLAATQATRNAATLGDWYAGFAAQYLPAGASSFAPVETETGAYFYCARQVSRRMPGELSIETFDGSGSRTVALAPGRFRIESDVEELREDGAEVRHHFTCTVRYERGRWVLEELRVGSDVAAVSTVR